MKISQLNTSEVYDFEEHSKVPLHGDEVKLGYVEVTICLNIRGATEFNGDCQIDTSSDDFVPTFWRHLFTEMIVKLEHGESDEFAGNIQQSNRFQWRFVKLGYVEVTTLRTTFRMAPFAGDGLSNWDTEGAVMPYTFEGATSFNGNLHGMSRVINLAHTFKDATAFKGRWIVNWDTSRVASCTKHSSGDLVHGRWIVKLDDVESDDFLEGTFYGATSFTGDGLSIGIRRV